MQQLHENLWIKRYPLSVLGTDHGRTVTMIRLQSGKLIVHSMAPFSSSDVAEIRALGEPAWLVEAMMLHDTYARQGHDTFPGIPFHGPEGFAEVVKFSTRPLLPAPDEWAGEVEVLELNGAPRLKEHVFIHRPSRTLIVADLVFNFCAEERGWNRFFHRYVAGFKRYPGMSRIFRVCISDRSTFRASLEKVLEANFDRIVVGHGEIIERDGKELLRRALIDAKVL
ncbi:MAG: hypothetical protein ABI680_08545 [Chthoniobacteraceae bacterium]